MSSGLERGVIKSEESVSLLDQQFAGLAIVNEYAGSSITPSDDGKHSNLEY